MTSPKASFLALGILLFALAAPGPALAQSSGSADKPVDLKPLLPPIIPPFLPPTSVLTPGSVGSGSYTGSQPYTSSPSEPAAGFKLSIPTR